MRLATPQQVKEAESAYANRLGLPLWALMEAAGGAVAEAVLRLRPTMAVVLAGPGNNGGDGFVCARRLHDHGIEVELRCTVDREALKGDAALAADAAVKAGVAVAWRGAGEPIPHLPGLVVVDALLGTGASRPAEGLVLHAMQRLAEARVRGAPCIAIDLPSGLDAATGRPTGPCVVADRTVTFAPLKVGLALDGALSVRGVLEVVDVGIPLGLLGPGQGPRVESIELAALAARFGTLDDATHKNARGHVLVVGGAPGKEGALALAGLGALHGGAGLVTLASRESTLLRARAEALEWMSVALPGAGPFGPESLAPLLGALERKQALCIGPGLDRSEESGALLRALLERLTVPVVIDADGLNALGVATKLPGRVVLTPHAGEAARLLGRSSAEVVADRFGAALDLVERTGAVVVLKGARTIVAAPGRAAVLLDSTPLLATAGSGDVLAGQCAALLAAERLPVFESACLAVALHASAGAVAGKGRRSLRAAEVAEALPLAWPAPVSVLVPVR